jgi:membrane protein DedA with SNARE-associated domain
MQADLVDTAVAWITAHAAWAGLVYGLLAFGESLVIVGVLIPATGVMIATGALVGNGSLPFLDLWIGGAIGASLGDSISFSIGRWLGPGIQRVPPFSRRPELFAAAERLFARWGWMAIVVGRFIGPLRASVPTVAGLAAMPMGIFQAANIGSAILWIPVLIAPGSIVGRAWALFQAGDRSSAALLAAAALAVLVAVVVLWRRFSARLFADVGKDPPPRD